MVLLQPQAAWIELGTSSRLGFARHHQAEPCLSRTNRGPGLLDLPVDILLSIASRLGTQATAQLQSTCRQLCNTLQDNKLWQSHLEQGYAFWTSSGIDKSQHACKNWKGLVAAASRFDKLSMPKNILWMPQAVFDEARRLWNSGKRLQLDFHFCQAESNLSYWRDLLGVAHFRVEHIAVLLEMVYFMWFEMGQLQRGICMLTKAVSLLADELKTFATHTGIYTWTHHECWYNSVELATVAASAAAFLIHVLQMTSSKQACCTTTTHLDTGPSLSSSSNSNLRPCLAQSIPEAFSTLLSESSETGNRVVQECTDAFEPDSWALLSAEGQMLLTTLLSSVNAPQDGESLPVQAVIHSTAQLSHAHVQPSPYWICKAHQLYTSSMLLIRLSGQGDLGLYACCQLGIVYHNAGKNDRAAWYFKLALQMAQTNPETADAKLLVLNHVPSMYGLNDFLPGGSLPTVKRGVVPAVNTLLENGHFDVLIASQDWHPQGHISFAASHGKSSGETLAVNGTKYQLFDQHCVQNTHGAEFPSGLDSYKYHKVTQKGTDKDEECFSAFCSFSKRQETGLADWLKQQGVGHLYIAGVALETCVKYTVTDALKAGFCVTLVQDACAPAEADSETDVWQQLQRAGCSMTTVAKALEATSA